jgi:primosomal protein N' (replication factor Y)
VTVGCRVRINLNGRRVGGFVVDVVAFEDHSGFDKDKLSPLVSVSGVGVEADVVPLTKWVASQWWGSWRAVLSSAAAPRVRDRATHARYGTSPIAPDDEVAGVTREIALAQGGLMLVPPLASALSVVATMALTGPVLAICPTLRMATLGAASLRRRGFTTAVVPHEWESARAGVDVVIGARSAVLAPCPNIAGIVVIDEHDESLQEERSPTWDATSVAGERARLNGVPFIATSAVPSLQSLLTFADDIAVVTSPKGWPDIQIVDLADVPLAGSLLSTPLLQSIRNATGASVVVLNTKGKARLLVCKACKAVQSCATCGALLAQGDDGVLHCVRCNIEAGSVCSSCGRAQFVVLRGGTTHLKSQIERSSRKSVVEVSSETEDTWTTGSVFIGTEAVLYRVPTAECIVFADIDRDLGAPRMSAASEVAALIARAARIVGTKGSLIVQTRQPEHPLLQAFAAQDPSSALAVWSESQMTQNKTLGLPPFSKVVKVTVTAPRTIDDLPELVDINIARGDGEVLLRAPSHKQMDDAILCIRAALGTAVRIHANPRRF